MESRTVLSNTAIVFGWGKRLLDGAGIIPCHVHIWVIPEAQIVGNRFLGLFVQPHHALVVRVGKNETGESFLFSLPPKNNSTADYPVVLIRGKTTLINCPAPASMAGLALIVF